MNSNKELTIEYDLVQLKARKEELEKQASQLATSSNTDRDSKAIVFADLGYYTNFYALAQTIDKKKTELLQAKDLLTNTEESADNAELTEMAKQDISSLESEIPTLLEELTQMQIERRYSDPDDLKSVILEIRAGAGGEEAALFASELYRMYAHFAMKNNWKVEMQDSSLSESGGFKEVIASIEGEGAYKRLKYESGVHRVQRVPVTESSGRIHTSTASVAILPQVKDIEIDIKPEELRIDVMRASGAGGQCVNRTDSAVRLTHLPTGIVVSCQETKHQAQNKEKAMVILRARLYAKKKAEEQEKRDSLRNSQIGSMMRAEKIRTYNFPQSRITDHRVKVSWHNVEAVMNGEIDQMVDDINKEIMKVRMEEDMKEGL